MTGPQTSARHKQQGEEAFGPAQGDSSRSNGVQLRKRDCGPRCPENFLTTSHLCPGAPTPAGSEQPWQEDRAGPPSVVAALICKRGVTDDRGRPGVLCTPCRSCRLSWGRGCAVASRTMAGRMPTVPPAPPACLPPASGWGGFLSLEEKKAGSLPEAKPGELEPSQGDSDQVHLPYAPMRKTTRLEKTFPNHCFSYLTYTKGHATKYSRPGRPPPHKRWASAPTCLCPSAQRPLCSCQALRAFPCFLSF